jgi:hypothetical protein
MSASDWQDLFAMGVTMMALGYLLLWLSTSGRGRR